MRTRVGRPVAVDALTPIQRRVLDHIATNPGTTIQDVADLLRSSHATATYHVTTLAKAGLIEAVRAGRELRHFVLPRGFSRELMITALRRDPRRKRLLAHLAEVRGSATINALASSANLPFGIVKRTLVQLEQINLARLERRHFRYRVTIHPDLVTLLAETER